MDIHKVLIIGNINFDIGIVREPEIDIVVSTVFPLFIIITTTTIQTITCPVLEDIVVQSSRSRGSSINIFNALIYDPDSEVHSQTFIFSFQPSRTIFIPSDTLSVGAPGLTLSTASDPDRRSKSPSRCPQM